ncbi:MAG: type II secretion system protein GspL [Gammaproteobacteria bacterium]|nr:type II secretion system protein GspL [Gammaproteobacteria bacterium]
MAEYLVIRLGPAVDNSAEWIVVDDNGTRRSEPRKGPLADAAAAAGGRPVIALVPAANVLTTSVDLPIHSVSKLRAALPFALEEYLAEDIGRLHFAAGGRRESGARPVAVVARSVIEDWLERLAAAGVEPVRLVPENYGLARIPGTMSVLVSGDTVMFNDGGDIEFVMEGVNPSDMLVAAGILGERESVAAGEQDRSGHLLVYCEPEDEQRLSHDWIALRHELSSVDINIVPDGALPRLAVTVASGSGVDLLQGQYGSKTDYTAQLKPWRKVAILLLGLLVVGFAAKGVSYYRLSNEGMALQAQFTEEYRQIRPGDSREIMDPVSAVRSIRQSLGGAAGPQVFLSSLRQLGDAIAKNPDATIETISYRAGIIDIRLSSPDVATLDKIRQAVGQSGQYQASIQSTDQVADRISSRMQIREAGS